MKKFMSILTFVLLVGLFSPNIGQGACPNGSGSIDNDPNTPYCMKTSANYCCIEAQQ